MAFLVFSLFHCDLTPPTFALIDIGNGQSTAIVIFRIFKESNKIHLNFCRNSLRQFWTELFAKNDFDLLTSTDLDLGEGHSKCNRLVIALFPTII